MLLVLLPDERLHHELILRHIEQQYIQQLAVQSRVVARSLKNLTQLQDQVLHDTNALRLANRVGLLERSGDPHSVDSLRDSTVDLDCFVVGCLRIIYINQNFETGRVDVGVAPLGRRSEVLHLSACSLVFARLLGREHPKRVLLLCQDQFVHKDVDIGVSVRLENRFVHPLHYVVVH